MFAQCLLSTGTIFTVLNIFVYFHNDLIDNGAIIISLVYRGGCIPEAEPLATLFLATKGRRNTGIEAVGIQQYGDIQS